MNPPGHRHMHNKLNYGCMALGRKLVGYHLREMIDYSLHKFVGYGLRHGNVPVDCTKSRLSKDHVTFYK